MEELSCMCETNVNKFTPGNERMANVQRDPRFWVTGTCSFERAI